MKTIAIIGGGCSGIALVSQIFKQFQTIESIEPCKILLIEKDLFARGSICKTTFPEHLLNVSAARMSLFPDDPHHFFHWMKSQEESISPLDFVPRIFYAKYLESILGDLEKGGNSRCQLEKIISEVVAIHPVNGQYVISFHDQKNVSVDVVVLALGNFPMNTLPVPGHEYLHHSSYFSDPWGELPKIPPHSRIAVIGTGLTSVDKLLEINGMDHQGEIHIISRHGLFPLPINYLYSLSRELSFLYDSNFQEDETISPDSFDFTLTARGILSAFQWGLKEKIPFEKFRKFFLHKLETKWNQENLEKTILPEEIRKIKRRVQRYISLLTHTVPSSSMDVINQMQKTKNLKVYAGRLCSVSVTDDVFEIYFSHRSTQKKEMIHADIIINCLGPVIFAKQCKNILIVQLMESGLIRPDSEGLLLDTTANGQVIDLKGNIHPSLFVLGSLKKHLLGSVKPVPEISIAAKKLAIHLATLRN